jgi:myo-inositol catabolism protein IolC
VAEIVRALYENALERRMYWGDAQAASLRHDYKQRLEKIAEASSDEARELLMELDELVGERLDKASYLAYQMGLIDGFRMYNVLAADKQG